MSIWLHVSARIDMHMKTWRLFPSLLHLSREIDRSTAVLRSSVYAGGHLHGLTLSSYVRLLACVRPSSAAAACQTAVARSAPLDVPPQASDKTVAAFSSHGLVTAARAQVGSFFLLLFEG
jgi:hypothetical protein